MSENIYFRVSDVCQFQSGAYHASSAMSDVSYRINSEANQAFSTADTILRKVDRVLRDMQEDHRAACEVRQHNEGVLQKLKEHLKELDYRYDELQKAYSRAYEAYRAAAAEETRLHNTSIPSTGNEEADKKAREAHSKALEAARKQVREMDRLCYQIKQQMAEVLRQIEETRRNISTVEQIIAELTNFINQIQTQCIEVERYRDRLRSDVSRLHDEMGRFQSAYSHSSATMKNCCDAADRAVTYGRSICNCLDPDQSVHDHDGCIIAFSDIHAMDRMSKSLMRVCEDYEEVSETISGRVSAYEDTMQDAVIEQSAATVWEVRDRCSKKIGELRKTARKCKEADVEIKHYYNLRFISL